MSKLIYTNGNVTVTVTNPTSKEVKTIEKIVSTMTRKPRLTTTKTKFNLTKVKLKKDGTPDARANNKGRHKSIVKAAK
tara:strand:+ start:50 stop:283 length:234 start_codon:yes stop_codon:yes gene_type:complete